MQLLGRCIKDLPREEIFVATKVGKYIPGEDEDFSADRVTKSVHESLKRMQLDYIDLIHCHDIESAKDMKQVAFLGYRLHVVRRKRWVVKLSLALHLALLQLAQAISWILDQRYLISDSRSEYRDSDLLLIIVKMLIMERMFRQLLTDSCADCYRDYTCTAKVEGPGLSEIHWNHWTSAGHISLCHGQVNPPPLLLHVSIYTCIKEAKSISSGIQSHL